MNINLKNHFLPSGINVYAFVAALLIVGFAIIPLFFNFPYRVNIFLSWEGAYRMYLGQVPFKDFTLPMGYAYWLIPALFFKIFGPYLFTLVISQVFINILAGFSFYSILNSFRLNRGIVVLSVLVFCVSYSFFNFWPWYNHTVIVFQLTGTAFVLKYIFNQQHKWRILYLIPGCLFLFLSFFTKQDGGALAFMISFVLIGYLSFHEKSIKPVLYFLLFYGLFAALFIVPLLPYDFSYWFNHGQPPHYSRVSLLDFAKEIFGASPWEKFYLFIIGLILLQKVNNFRSFIANKREVVFLLLTLGIIVEALIFQVTSYVPPGNNIFFHSFAIAYILSNLNFNLSFERPLTLIITSLFILLWWSGVYWKYLERIASRILPETHLAEDSNVVSKNSWTNTQKDSSQMAAGPWIFSDLKAFERIYMPAATVEGIRRFMAHPIVKSKNDAPQILNLTELTPLAYEAGFALPAGKDQPLWYHQGVSIFQPQVDKICDKIKNQEYDMVLYEFLAGLNNFYAFQIRDCLKEYYLQADEFPAPRSDGYSPIEVYVRK